MATGMLIFFCVVVSIGLVSSVLPDGWTACKQSSSDYEKCLKTQIGNAVVSLKNGNQKLGIKPLDPLIFDSMTINQKTGPVTASTKLTNVSFTGLSNLKITSVKNNWKNMVIQFNVPSSRIAGLYSGKGNVLFLPINGVGDFYIDWINLDVKADNILTQVTKSGKKYFQVESIEIDLSPQNVVIYFGNLFNGNKVLGDTMNKFLNDNWREILRDIMPAISAALGEGCGEYINSILIQIPANEIDV